MYASCISTIATRRSSLFVFHIDQKEAAAAFAIRISSEVATMRYIVAKTSIPVPRVIYYTVEAHGFGVGSPYMIMTKMDGVSLVSVWNKMENPGREVKQAVDILFELSYHRFEKVGILFQKQAEDDKEQDWYMARCSTALKSLEIGCQQWRLKVL